MCPPARQARVKDPAARATTDARDVIVLTTAATLADPDHMLTSIYFRFKAAVNFHPLSSKKSLIHLVINVNLEIQKDESDYPVCDTVEPLYNVTFGNGQKVTL